MSVCGDSFKSSGGCNISDSSGSFNLNSGGGFDSAHVGTRDYSGGTVGSEDYVSTPQVPRRTGGV